MDIFESLENLQVSEECFEDIIELVEVCLSEDSNEIENRIIKKYGEPDYGRYEGQKNKPAKLIDKFRSARTEEQRSAAARDTVNKMRLNLDDEEWWSNPKNRKRYSKELDKVEDKVSAKRYTRDKANSYPNSLLYGKTALQNWKGDSPLNQHIAKSQEKSIARHNK
jgi:hypothetical protein